MRHSPVGQGSGEPVPGFFICLAEAWTPPGAGRDYESYRSQHEQPGDPSTPPRGKGDESYGDGFRSPDARRKASPR